MMGTQKDVPSLLRRPSPVYYENMDKEEPPSLRTTNAAPSPSASSNNTSGYRFLSIVLAFVVGMATMQTMNLGTPNSLRAASASSSITVVPAFQEVKPIFRNPAEHTEKCRFYLAESAVAPNAGLGVFAGVGLLKGDMIGFPDICLFVHDPPKRWTHLHSHSWSGSTFFGQLGERPDGKGQTRIQCEGYGTIHNTMPKSHLNTKLQSGIQQTNGGIRRDMPGAGSSSHHYGIHGVAMDIVPAGGELTIDYGDWKFEKDSHKNKRRPQRPVSELEQDGWCIDHMDIRQSTIPGAGRGAFVKRHLAQGSVVAPAPLEVFRDRAAFQNSKPEQLYVNYCLQPQGSKMLFFPYGPGNNLINHASNGNTPNVALQWSNNHMHRADLLEMEYDDFWDNVKPGKLVLEFVALRDLVPGEELFLDYGPVWQNAWETHVANWVPLPHSEDWVYPEDMDDTATLRTVEEQKTEPYPPNLITMCHTPDQRRRNGNHIEWYEGSGSWWWSVAYCHILDRKMGENGLLEYTVALVLDASGSGGRFTKQDLDYNPTIPFLDLYVDTHVPRRAIHWVERPYHDDEHIIRAFRHPIQFPDELVSKAWLDTE